MIRSEKIAYGSLLGMCIACMLFFSVTTFLQDWKKDSVVPNVHIEAANSRSLNDTAYVFLGLGATAHQLNCPAAIESLVRYGGWNGKVYLITDQGNCFDREQMIKDSGIDPANLELIVLKEDFGGGGIDLWNSKVGFSKNRLRSKSMKTKLFDLIPDPQIQVLAYVDCDILFGVQGCPAKFVEGGVPWSERKIRFSRVTEDPNTHRLVNIHTGTIVMHRQHSKEVLQRWYDRLNTGVDNMDRTVEYNAVQETLDYSNNTLGSDDLLSGDSHLRRRNQVVGASSLSNITYPTRVLSTKPNVMMPSELTYLDDAGEIAHYEVFVDPTSDVLPCMTHISKARCDLFGRRAVQHVVDRFQLRTYKQGYMYCPNPALAPVLYGWFPLSYLPFCPKIEMFH